MKENFILDTRVNGGGDFIQLEGFSSSTRGEEKPKAGATHEP